MKATRNFIKSIPSDALVSYSNRIDPGKNFSSSWGTMIEDFGEDFAEQFVGATVTTSIDDGHYDSTEMSHLASGKRVYSAFIEEGEHTDSQGACAAERMAVMWSE